MSYPPTLRAGRCTSPADFARWAYASAMGLSLESGTTSSCSKGAARELAALDWRRVFAKALHRNANREVPVILVRQPAPMTDALQTSEPTIRLSIFAVVFITMALLEASQPRRPQAVGRLARWPSNLAIVVLDTVIVRLIFPLSAVALALLAEARGWGLMNVWQVPAWIAVPLAVVLLDLVIYLQHVMFHAVPALWRLHRMHHADLEFDVTTGSRFHPVEIMLSMVIKLTVVAALGAPALAVLIFEILLNATAMFNHSNFKLPLGLDRALRWIVVTPDMHRVHHSVVVGETNSNFGFNLPWWDRLLGTYRDQPAAGHDRMTIGVAEIRDPAEQRLDRMLTQPFRLGSDGYPISGPVDREHTRS